MSQDGDARRFCGVCVKQVHDLSALTEPQARAVIADESAKGHMCVRYKADRDGNIKFKAETVSASNLWRMTLAAAGMTLALLTGCTDTTPDRVLADRCEYEVGPWGFTAERGQGTCPAVEPDPEVAPETEVVGQIMIEPPPPEPEVTIKGEVAPEPEPELVPTMGDIPAPQIEPRLQPKMGKIARPEPVPRPETEMQIMGGLAIPDPIVAPNQEPCDPVRDGSAESDAPGRI